MTSTKDSCKSSLTVIFLRASYMSVWVSLFWRYKPLLLITTASFLLKLYSYRQSCPWLTCDFVIPIAWTILHPHGLQWHWPFHPCDWWVLCCLQLLCFEILGCISPFTPDFQTLLNLSPVNCLNSCQSVNVQFFQLILHPIRHVLTAVGI